MNKVFLSCLLLICFVTATLPQGNEDRLKYIEKYKDIAVSEMNRAGIPASIKLAQGILESNSGKSYLARKANNHFGMKCGSKSQWDGKKVYREDDDYDANGKLQKSCFRAYKSGDASYIAHSDFLRDSRKAYRYGFLFRLDAQDYKRWARGLKQSGYATGANYDRKLISIIETYSLDQYDKIGIDLANGKKKKKKDKKSSTTNTAPDRPVLVGLSTVNDIRVIAAKEGETPTDISNRAATDLKCILKYNEELNNPDQALTAGTPVFIQPKRSSFRGRQQFHKVKEGESMYDISQMYGIKLKKIYKNNRMDRGSQPAVGEKIKLRGKTKNPPRLRSQRIPDRPQPGMDLEEDELPDFEEDRPVRPAPKPPVVVPTPPVEDIPVVEPTPAPPIEQPTYNPPAPTEPAVQYHTVVKGETLYRISQRYGITVAEIIKINNLSSATIRVGQRLRVK